MEYLIGLVLTVAVAAFATVIGFDRERAFYPTVLIVIASYYALFAVMGASTRTLIIESIVAGVFVLFAVLGFKGNYWLVVAALFAHGVFDLVRHFFIDNRDQFCFRLNSHSCKLSFRPRRGNHTFV